MDENLAVAELDGREVKLRRTSEVRWNDTAPEWFSRHLRAKGKQSLARLEQAWVVDRPDEAAGFKVWVPVPTVPAGRKTP